MTTADKKETDGTQPSGAPEGAPEGAKVTPTRQRETSPIVVVALNADGTVMTPTETQPPADINGDKAKVKRWMVGAKYPNGKYALIRALDMVELTSESVPKVVLKSL